MFDIIGILKYYQQIDNTKRGTQVKISILSTECPIRQVLANLGRGETFQVLLIFLALCGLVVMMGRLPLGSDKTYSDLYSSSFHVVNLNHTLSPCPRERSVLDPPEDIFFQEKG